MSANIEMVSTKVIIHALSKADLNGCEGVASSGPASPGRVAVVVNGKDGKRTVAIRPFNLIFENTFEGSKLLFLRALLLMRDANWEEAARMFGHVVVVGGPHIDALAFRAECWLYAGQTLRAKAAANMALSMNLGHIRSASTLLLAYAEEGYVVLACSLADTFLKRMAPGSEGHMLISGIQEDLQKIGYLKGKPKGDVKHLRPFVPERTVFDMERDVMITQCERDGIYKRHSGDYSKAKQLFEVGTELGSTTSMMELAQMLKKGGPLQDIPKWIELLQRCVRQKSSSVRRKEYADRGDDGYAAACEELATCYMHGIGVKKDIEKALQYLQNAVDLGSAKGLYLMACRYMNLGMKREALEYAWDAASDYDYNALCFLAKAYATGNGFHQHFEMAEELYGRCVGNPATKAAAEQGLAELPELRELRKARGAVKGLSELEATLAAERASGSVSFRTLVALATSLCDSQVAKDEVMSDDEVAKALREHGLEPADETVCHPSAGEDQRAYRRCLNLGALREAWGPTREDERMLELMDEALAIDNSEATWRIYSDLLIKRALTHQIVNLYARWGKEKNSATAYYHAGNMLVMDGPHKDEARGTRYLLKAKKLGSLEAGDVLASMKASFNKDAVKKRHVVDGPLPPEVFAAQKRLMKATEDVRLPTSLSRADKLVDEPLDTLADMAEKYLAEFPESFNGHCLHMAVKCMQDCLVHGEKGQWDEAVVAICTAFYYDERVITLQQGRTKGAPPPTMEYWQAMADRAAALFKARKDPALLLGQACLRGHFNDPRGVKRAELLEEAVTICKSSTKYAHMLPRMLQELALYQKTFAPKKAQDALFDASKFFEDHEDATLLPEVGPVTRPMRTAMVSRITGMIVSYIVQLPYAWEECVILDKYEREAPRDCRELPSVMFTAASNLFENGGSLAKVKELFERGEQAVRESVPVMEPECMRTSPAIRHTWASIQLRDAINTHYSPADAETVARQLGLPAVSTSEPPALCWGCDKEATGVKRCSRCRVALYCSRDCQKKDWKAHKKTCGK